MRSLLVLFILFSLICQGQLRAMTTEDNMFRGKLNKLYHNTNESIKILRDQISENQLAPFLPNLFLELGNLLSKKASIMYYVKKEKGVALTEKSKDLLEIENITKEAAEIYQKILDEFPRFDRKAQVLFSLAITYKSLNMTPQFYKYANLLTKNYPKEEKTYKVQVLLGVELLKKGLIDEALKIFESVAKCPFKIEANQARIQIAEVLVLKRQFATALDLYKKVVVDNLLAEEDEDSRIEAKFANITLSDDVKNDALRGSTKIFPYVFPKNPRPIEYYSSFVPTEKLFQDAIEKLAYRYVSLSKFDTAISLFRKLSERIASPEKVINIYRDVLSRIPLSQRALFPVEEVHFVMKQFNDWRSYFNPDRPILISAYRFFEKHLRDIATRRHDLAKKAESLAKSTENKTKSTNIHSNKLPDYNKIKMVHLEAAQELYQLYLSYFPRSSLASQLKYNLADTYFRSKNFPKCAETYIEVYHDKKKLDMLEKAVYCLSQDFTANFYESKRSKGLMIYSLSELMRKDPKRRKDVKTQFFLLKAEFDQGLLDKALPGLEKFIKLHSKSQYASEASDIIIDFYNTKGDYETLRVWAKKMQGIKFATRGYNAKLAELEKQAKIKLLNSKIEGLSSGEEGVLSGASYLQSAMNIEDKELQSLALKNAFLKSKTDEDIGTFFKTATILADKTSDQAEKVEIYSLMAREKIKMGHYNSGQKIYSDLLGQNISNNSKATVFEESFSYALLFRDFSTLAKLAQSSNFKSLKSNIIQNFNNLVLQAFSSPVHIDGEVVEGLLKVIPRDLELGLALYKLAPRYQSGNTSAIINGLIETRCKKGNTHVLCGWIEFEATAQEMALFNKNLKEVKNPIEYLEKFAIDFETILAKQGRFKGRDPSYDMLVNIHEAVIYKNFGLFIAGVAKLSPDLQSFLAPRAQQLMATSKQLSKICQQITLSSSTITPFNSSCARPTLLAKQTWWNWKKVKKINYNSEASESFSQNLKKKHFSDKEESSGEKLAYAYLTKQYPHLGNLVLQQTPDNRGNKLYKEAIKGCALSMMGYFGEAHFLLHKNQLKLARKCMGFLR